MRRFLLGLITFVVFAALFQWVFDAPRWAALIGASVMLAVFTSSTDRRFQ